jgi:hypothetical protein
MSSLLHTYIDSRFGRPLTGSEAEQFIFAIFCTLDVLPAELRATRWDRTTLTHEFVELTNEGMIKGDTNELTSESFWNHVIDRFLLHKTPVDDPSVMGLQAPNQSTDPTLASGTPGAGHQSRHP